MKQVKIYKDGWFNGTRVPKKYLAEQIGLDGIKKVNEFIRKLKDENLKHPEIMCLSVNVNKIEYEFILEIN